MKATVTALFTLLSAAVYAQSITSSSPRVTSTATTTSATNSSASSYTTRTIWLPLSNLGRPAASVITAAPESTVYALACLYASTTNCTASPSITITEGLSTLIYTMTFAGSDGATTRGPATINCTLSESLGTSSAICAGQTSLDGLGAVTSTSTVANTYVPVSITAGGDNLLSVAMQTASTGSGASSTSSAGGSVVTGGWLAAGGAAGLLALGAL